MNIFHKIQLLTLIAIVTSVSILVYIDQSYAACIFDEETGEYLEPCQGLPILH